MIIIFLMLSVYHLKTHNVNTIALLPHCACRRCRHAVPHPPC
jgi:hypothetical protein